MTEKYYPKLWNTESILIKIRGYTEVTIIIFSI